VGDVGLPATIDGLAPAAATILGTGAMRMPVPRIESATQTRGRAIPAILGLCLCITPPISASAILAAPAETRVTHRARSLQPGEVVAITVDSPHPLHDVRVAAFGRSFSCFETADPLKWSSLIGIDLDTTPGRYVVAVTARDADGKAVTVEYPITIAPKTFATRTLTVDPQFVTPPREALARIEQESKKVRAILDVVSPERYWIGPFVLPVPGRTISEFGKRSVYNGQPRSPHAGTDFAGATGTPVKAPNAGRVVLAANLYYSGNTIILDHGCGLFSYFGHLSVLSVHEGDAVATGDVVGKVGATGLVTGPHLHWSVRLAGTRVDPLSLIDVLTPHK
jgi:murein DD-endopeptidase MepM/ murein hydrolase activator NlpD